MGARRRLALVLLATLTLICAGCGITTNHGHTKTDPPAKRTTQQKQSSTEDASETTSTIVSTSGTLQNHSPNDLIVDGYSQGSLSELAQHDYEHQGGADQITIEDDATATAFSDLCSGRVDVVDSSTQITKAETKTCTSNGIRPVQIQVASDAVVLATENETDVGADCLTMAQVRSTFSAGSPVSNWSQLGFDDVHLSVAGPNPESPTFSFFGQDLVGDSDPSLVDFRYNYRAKSTQGKIRQFVIGTEQAGELAAQDLPNQLSKVSTAKAYISGQQATLVGANKAIKVYTRQSKTVLLGNARGRRRKAIRLLKQYRAQVAAANKLITHDRLVEKQAQNVLGHLGVFHYNYYTLYEQQLRPLEITSKSKPENCVFPSQTTITSGEYPLSRRLLLTFSLEELQQNESLRTFLLSYLNNANTLATKLQMVPLPPDVLTQEKKWLEGKDVTSTTSTTTTATTPTSTTPGEENSMSGTGSGVTEPGNEQGTTETQTTTPSGGSGASTTSSSVPQGVH